MAQTYQAVRNARGDSADYTPGSAVSAGAPQFQSALAGYPAEPISASVLGALAIEGVYDVVKKNGAIAAGVPIFWDAAGDPQGGTAGTGAASATPTAGYKPLGISLIAAGATDEVVRIKALPGLGAALLNTLLNKITDPGNAGAIPVTNSGSCDIVTAGAETRTLAAPSFRGQQISLCMKTDGGDGVITCATGINQTGNNTITMNDAGDSILLVAITNGANLRWRAAYNDGCTLSTV